MYYRPKPLLMQVFLAAITTQERMVVFIGRCRGLLFHSEECLQAHIEDIHKREEGRLTPAAYPRPETILLPSEKLNLLALSSVGQYPSVHVLQSCENHSVSVHTRYNGTTKSCCGDSIS